jgi:hypothetical protein
VAHDKLRQMPFFISVLINKWASIFEEEWKEYIELGGNKSESGFVLYLVSRGRKKSKAGFYFGSLKLRSWSKTAKAQIAIAVTTALNIVKYTLS